MRGVKWVIYRAWKQERERDRLLTIFENKRISVLE